MQHNHDSPPDDPHQDVMKRSTASPEHMLLGSTALPYVIVAGITLALLAAIALNASPYLRGPAPWPPDWRWSFRHEAPLRGLPGALGVSAILAGLIYLTTTLTTARRPRLVGGTLLAGAALASFGLHFSLIAMEDGRSAADILVRRTVSPEFTSYYSVAVSPVCRDVGEFVRGHAELLDKLPLHARTHPLGPILYFRGLLHVLEESPAVTDAVLRIAGWLDVDPGLLSVPGIEPAVATAVSGVLLLMLGSSLSCIAVAALARAIGASAQEAICTAIIWSVVPGFALMVPELDRFLTFPLTSAAALLVIAFRPGASRNCRALATIGAGVMAGIALQCSYGAALFLVYGGAVAVAAVPRGTSGNAQRVASVACVAAGVATLLFFLPSFFGHDSIAALKTAVKMHRAVFTEPRSYSMWVGYNVWELVVFLGFPVAVVWICRAARSIAAVVRRGGPVSATAPVLTCFAATVGVLLIDLTGLVRGEVGRIWIPILPFLLVSTLAFDSLAAAVQGSEEDRATRLQPLAWPAFLFVLLLACSVVLRRSWHLP